jgi:uncharacterized protein YbjT (DUF2867 family)
MKKILITGATGNIGLTLIKYIDKIKLDNKIIAGLRDLNDKERFSQYSDIDFVLFDFENEATFDNALKDIDRVFLLRPPHISDIDKYFKPLFDKFKEYKINDIVFLSVQGAEISKVIPHNKIERLIKEYQFNYIFIRPSYFMQNLTTTLLNGIKEKNEIVLPSGNAKFNWVDVENISEVCAILLIEFDKYLNKSFEITGYENLSYPDVVKLMNKSLKHNIKYISMNPISFYFYKRREGLSSGFAIVMLILHFLPRFQDEPKISRFYEELTNKKPSSINEFINREKNKWE